MDKGRLQLYSLFICGRGANINESHSQKLVWDLLLSYTGKETGFNASHLLNDKTLWKHFG
jgi:hypothetical protein